MDAHFREVHLFYYLLVEDSLPAYAVINLQSARWESLAVISDDASGMHIMFAQGASTRFQGKRCRQMERGQWPGPISTGLDLLASAPNH